MNQLPLTFTLIQTNLLWEDKLANLDMLEQKIESITQKTEVVILPEMFSTGFSMTPAKWAETMEGPTVEWMRRLAVTKKLILTGSLIIKDSSPVDPSTQEVNDKLFYYNRLIWMLPNGHYGYYDKRHLFAYADEDKSYNPGNKRIIASVKGWKINLQVCYDLRFPVWARQTPSQGKYPARESEYDVLIYVANWPEKRSLAWKTLLQARAIENQCYVIGVNRVGHDGNHFYHSGDSMVIDPLGDILYHKNHVEDIFTITLDKDKLNDIRKQFPFWRDGDAFMLSN